MNEPLDITRRDDGSSGVEGAARNRLRRTIDSWLDAMSATQLDRVRASVEQVIGGRVLQ